MSRIVEPNQAAATDVAHRPHVPEHVASWRRFCEWLNAVPGHAAYVGAMPADLRWLVTSRRTWGGDRDGLTFYMSGWGWRLRRGWREELARRENAHHKEVP